MKNRKGFTLVELLVVIVILGGLILLIMPTVLNSMESSNKNLFFQEVVNFSNKSKSAYELGKSEHGANAPLCYRVDNLKDGDTFEGCIIMDNDKGTVGEVHVYNNEFKFETGVKNSEDGPNPTADTSVTYATLVSEKGKAVGKLRSGKTDADADKAAILAKCPTDCHDASVVFDGTVVPVTP